MSAQYGSIGHRRTVELPMWLAALLVAIFVVMSVLAVLGRDAGSTTATSVGAVRSSVYTDSTANIREGGATFPAAMALDVRPGRPIGNDGWTGAGLRGSRPQPPIVVGGYACHQCG